MTDPLSREALNHVYETTVVRNKYLARQALLPPQFLFLTHPAYEILYGGSAGSGKSRALLCAALQYVMIPNYAACIVRRTFGDLEQAGGLLDQAREILAGTDAVWNGAKFHWSFPNGARLDFKYFDVARDADHFQGGAWQFFGIDELTQFPESRYRYLFSRLRRIETIPIPLRMRGATNPGGVGHVWVKKRFLDEKTRVPGTLFVPAKLDDNKFLDRDSYRNSLDRLDSITRAQLRDGNWEITAAGLCFRQEWFRYHEDFGSYYTLGGKVVSTSQCTRFLAADIAGTEKLDTEAVSEGDPDYSVLGVWDLSSRGELILRDFWRGRKETPDVEKQVMRLYYDHDCQFALVEKNGLGLPICQNLRRRQVNVMPVVAKTDKFARSQSAQIFMECGRMWFPRGAPYMEDILTEMLPFPVKGAHDDIVDMVSIAAQKASKISEPMRNLGAERREETETEEAKKAAKQREESDRLRREQEMLEGDFGWTSMN